MFADWDLVGVTGTLETRQDISVGRRLLITQPAMACSTLKDAAYNGGRLIAPSRPEGLLCLDRAQPFTTSSGFSHIRSEIS
jgi:hypothetical protein